MNQKKMNRILHYASLNVPFYKGVIDEIFSEKKDGYELLKKFPVITKDDFYLNKEKMFSESLSREELFIEKTSGSSGQPLTIFKTKDDQLCQLKESWKFRKEHYDINPMDTFCRFIYRNESNKSNAYIEKNILYLNALKLNESIMNEFTDAINQFKPTWCFTTPSTLYYYMNFLKKDRRSNQLIHKLKFIELTGEKVMPQIKSELEDFFKCSIGNNYGSTETYAIAMTCKHNTMHVLRDNAFIEVLDENLLPVENGVEGNIVVTSYNNRAMPFIRYRLGDQGMFIPYSDCPCGNHGPILKLNNVRFTQSIKLKDGQILSPIIFCLLLDEVCKKHKCIIAQFKVIQEAYETFHMEVVLSDVKNRNDILTDIYQVVIKCLREKIGDNVELNLQDVENSSLIPNKFSGKLAYFLTFND